MKMEFKDNIPIYLQIQDYIYRQIATGKLRPGDKLPSVRALAVELTVNVNTVQRALRELSDKGYIYTKRGEGNFVTDNADLIVDSQERLIKQVLAEFVARMRELGVGEDKLVAVLGRYLEQKQ